MDLGRVTLVGPVSTVDCLDSSTLSSNKTPCSGKRQCQAILMELRLDEPGNASAFASPAPQDDFLFLLSSFFLPESLRCCVVVGACGTHDWFLVCGFEPHFVLEGLRSPPPGEEAKLVLSTPYSTGAAVLSLAS